MDIAASSVCGYSVGKLRQEARLCPKKVKDLVENDIPSAEFHTPKQKNESALVILKDTRDVEVKVVSESQRVNIPADMRKLIDASSVLRKAVTKAKPWNFSGSLIDTTEENVPQELYAFLRWILEGHRSNLMTEMPKGQLHMV